MRFLRAWQDIDEATPTSLVVVGIVAFLLLLACSVVPPQ